MAMVADELLPEAYEVEAVLTGVLLVVGLALSLCSTRSDQEARRPRHASAQDLRQQPAS